MNSLRRIFLSSFILLCLTFLTAMAADQAPTFKAGTDVVLVPVTVRDSSGAPVTGLTKAEFSISEGGKLQTISVFEEVHTATGVQPGTKQSNVFTNEFSGDMQPQRVTIIALDMSNTSFSDQAY